MRRLLPFLLCLVCVPMAFLVAFSGEAQAGPRSKLVSSWVDTHGAAHLNFDVQGVSTGDVLTARLFLHRRADGPASDVLVSTAGNGWFRDVGWYPSRSSEAATQSAGDIASTVVGLDVSDVVRGNGPVSFIVSSIDNPSVSDVIAAPDAGDDAPSLDVGALPTAAGSESTSAGVEQSPVPSPSTVSASEPDAQPSGSVTASQSADDVPSSSAGQSDDPSDPVTTPSPSPTDAGSSSAEPTPASSPTASPAVCGISPILVPTCGVWWGIGANPLAGESWDQAIADFETQQNRPTDLLHYYHVGSGLFPTAREISRAHAGGLNRMLLENWKPELGRTWAQVAAGDPVVDAAIDHEAAYLTSSYTAPFFLAVHHEPENEIIPTAGSGFTASDYAAMYRHVVLRLRADGVTNAVFVVDYMGAPKWGEQSWFNDLYPGDDVVDWIAEDPYSVGSGGVWRADFAGMVDRRDGSSWPDFYTWATTTHPGKPIMLAEWGVTEDPLNPLAKADFFSTMLSQLQRFPAIKALVYWNAPGAEGGTRIDSDPAALAAFQQLGATAGFHVSLP